MRALIIDDEPLARRELRRLLAEFDWLSIEGEAANIEEAKQLIEALDPALIFLDIKMPGGTGFDLLEQLEHMPQVIFTTAYEEHAVKAFDANALDYLLKPIDPERLAVALAKVKRGQLAQNMPTEPYLEQLFVRDGPRCWFVPLQEVSLMTVEGNYVRLRWGQQRPLLSRPLSALETRLDPKKWFRANRSQMFNIGHIETVELGVNGRLHVQLIDGPEIEISRRQARRFREITTI